MAKKQPRITDDDVETVPEKSTEETYKEHNHETAQASDARLQCQCDECKSYRGE